MDNFIVITVGDKDYGFKFTMPTLERICRKEGLEYHQLGGFISKHTLSALMLILQCGNAVYEGGKELNDIEIGDIIDGMEGKQISEVIEVWNESLTHILTKLIAMQKADVKKK